MDEFFGIWSISQKKKKKTKKCKIKNHFLPINYFHWSADFHSVCHCHPSETAS